jgi:ParB family chromosome partitioning protein
MSIYDKIGAKTAGVKARTVEKSADKAPRTAPGMLLDATQRIDAAEAKVEELEAKLKETAATGRLMLPLNQLRKKLGRQRKLSAKQYSELEENLRNNEQATPIVVRKLAAEEYEIETGNNRFDIFHGLGRTEIWAVLSDSDEGQAELNAFYSNLLQTELPDFEKYLGFKKIIEMRPESTHAQIADAAGVSRSFVTQLLAFDELPKEAIAILAEKPDAIGANAAQDLAALTRKGRAAQVVGAIAKVAAGEMEQGKAVKEAATDPAPDGATARPEPVRIKIGKATYCAIQRADKVLRIQFQSAEEAEAVQHAVQEVLERRAKQLK